LSDQIRLDSLLERLDLQPDPPVEVRDLATERRLRPFRPLLGGARLGPELAGELVEAHRTEDPLGEEALDQWHQCVLAEVEPFTMIGDLGGGLFAVASGVVAAVVAVALPLPAVH
jgi:hypothetical protein